MDLLAALPEPKIISTPDPAAQTAQQGFRLMGQRFIPDSYILDKLVYDKIPDLRTMPTALDVIAVLGSERALALLQQTPDWSIFPSYPARLDSLYREFAAFPAEIWAQNLYWNWLYTLMPMLFPKGNGYPDWMQTTAWVDKDLLAALGSWAELRHDTILYAKQSVTTGGSPTGAVGKQGYVEPNPHLFARLAALAAFMRDGLENRGLLFDEFKADIELLHETVVQLLNIAEKELTDRPLTADDYEVILYFGRTIEEIVESGVTPISGPGPDSEAAMPVVADVHTDGISFTVLEEGVGYPYCIDAICPIEGQLVLTRGAAFSYYELTRPIENRLTDEQWRQMLQSNEPPVVPTWTGSFAAETDWRNPHPDFYYCQLPAIRIPWISLPTDSFRAGEKVRADIRYHVAPVSDGTLEVWIETAAGEKSQADSLFYLGDDNFRAVLSTTGLTPGKAWVVAQAPAPDILSSDSLQTYRAGFIIDDPTSVDQSPQTELPQAFALLPTWPNPFNAGVAIAFDLPNPSTCDLQVFDVAGRLVRTLARGAFPAGQHHLRWDGRDDREQMLASGIYLIRFVAGEHDETRKIILLR